MGKLSVYEEYFATCVTFEHCSNMEPIYVSLWNDWVPRLTHQMTQRSLKEPTIKIPYLTPFNGELAIRASFCFNTTHVGLSYVVKFGWKCLCYADSLCIYKVAIICSWLCYADSLCISNVAIIWSCGISWSMVGEIFEMKFLGVMWLQPRLRPSEKSRRVRRIWKIGHMELSFTTLDPQSMFLHMSLNGDFLFYFHTGKLIWIPRTYNNSLKLYFRNGKLIQIPRIHNNSLK